MFRYQDMNRFEKIVILAMVICFAIFTVLYAVITSQKGYRYCDTLLVRRIEDGNTVFAGEIDGKQACFTISSDGVITFLYSDKTYGPYTVKDDPTAIPSGKGCTNGIEIREGNEVIFRGGYVFLDGWRLFYNEDGSSSSVGSSVSTGNGNAVKAIKPSVYTILELAEGPKLEHNGSWLMWLLGTFSAGMTIVSVFFADALFRLRLSFHVQDVNMVEPSGWELDRRTISWISSLILVPILYIIGLCLHI